MSGLLEIAKRYHSAGGDAQAFAELRAAVLAPGSAQLVADLQAVVETDPLSLKDYLRVVFLALQASAGDDEAAAFCRAVRRTAMDRGPERARRGSARAAHPVRLCADGGFAGGGGGYHGRL